MDGAAPPATVERLPNGQPVAWVTVPVPPARPAKPAFPNSVTGTEFPPDVFGARPGTPGTDIRRIFGYTPPDPVKEDLEMNDDAAVGMLSSLAVLFSGVFLIVLLAITVVMIASAWKVFTKAGQPGWAAIVPIYNVIVILQIIGRPLWWILLAMIPLVNIAIGIIIMIDLARSFGKGGGFALGLLFLGWIFFPILGFGSSRYLGPASAPGALLATT